MAKFVLLAMIGAKLDMGAAYWVLYGVYAFCWIIDCFFLEG